MTTRIKNLFLLPALMAGLGSIPAGQARAQTFTNLHNFDSLEGELPICSLVLSGNTLYGEAVIGGSWNNGTVFALNTNGTGFATLHSFTARTDTSFTNKDGVNPISGLVLSGDTLCGMATGGGSWNSGTTFALNTNGTGFTILHSFSYGSNGGNPYSGLFLSGNTLYGTADGGGTWTNGTLFAVNTDGTGFTPLYSFSARSTNAAGAYTNSDGSHPCSTLLLSGNTLYGAALIGGSAGNGTVFAVNTNGTGFMTLHNFTETETNSSGVYTNNDGAQLWTGLVLSGNTLYGTGGFGGTSGNGTVFAVNTNGTGFTTLYNFTAGTGSGTHITNSDGAAPGIGPLVLSGHTLYGTCRYGGTAGNGTVFAVNTDGTGFTTLHSFSLGSDGGDPRGGLILSGNTLYGVAESGGSSGAGTAFSLTLPPVLAPQLTIIAYGASVVLTWPTNANSFTLQSATNLGSSAGWTTNSPGPFVVNGQNTVTNPITGTQQFFRLIQ